MADDKHRKDQKLHNSRKKLHNSAAERLRQEETHEETSYEYTEDGNVRSARQRENKSRLVDLRPIDWQAYFDDIVAESEARWARAASEAEQDHLPKDPNFEYDIARIDLSQEIAKKAMKREAITITPQPITLVPAPSVSPTQTQQGTAAIRIDSGDKPSNTPKISFERFELDHYVTQRSEGLAKKSLDWINRASEALWRSTQGEISRESMTALRVFTLDKYTSVDSHRKVLGFAVAFLKFIAKARFDPKIQSFEVYLELPKAIKVRKAVTERIVRRDDVVAVLKRIGICAQSGKIDPIKTRNYRAFVFLAAYTGLRPSTIQRLTVGQVRAAVSREKPVLHVLSEQEKNRVEHYVPLHHAVVVATSEVLKHDFGENDNNKLLFMFNSFEKWLERQRIPLPRVRDPSKAHLWLSPSASSPNSLETLSAGTRQTANMSWLTA
jgi:integrase